MKHGFKYSLGFMNYCSHDPAACLSRIDAKGRLEYIHFEEGMLSRKKKSYQFPTRSIYQCLNHFNIEIGDVDQVVVDYMNEKDFFGTAKYFRKLIGDYLRAFLNVEERKVLFADSHHLAHAYTAFYPSPFQSGAILVIDGLGSKQDTHTIYTASRADGISKIYSQKGFGIGALYSLITDRLGFEDGEEGKTMGLAPYGARFGEWDKKLPSLAGDYYGFFADYSRIVQRSPSLELKVDVERCGSKKDLYGPYFSRLAYLVQQELERCLLHLGREIRERTGHRNLCIAGGVGLNCVANEVLRQSRIFDDIFVQPASGDSGIPLGLSLIGIDRLMESSDRSGAATEKFAQESFWKYAPADARSETLSQLLERHSVHIQKYAPVVVANELSKGKVVAFFEGGWEFGPRALGHRSFLADPRSIEMKQVLNQKIKHRERYRPFAPIMLKEHFGEYFESLTSEHPFMLFAVKCKAKAREHAPAIVHEDNTARVQTCDASAGGVHAILTAFYSLTGVPILVNTSFNDNDEPIVYNSLDALCSFLRTNADILVVEGSVVYRDQIASCQALLSDASKAQAIQQADLFSRAARAILRLDGPVEDVESFLARELLSSLYAKHASSCERLGIEFFGSEGPSRNRWKILVTDPYHMEILERLSIYYKREIPNSEVVLLDDCSDSIPLIPEGAFVLLYNLSIHLNDTEVVSRFPHLRSCSSFYSLKDRKAVLRIVPSSIEEVLSAVSAAYEVDPARNIQDFFAGKVRTLFDEMFL